MCGRVLKNKVLYNLKNKVLYNLKNKVLYNLIFITFVTALKT